jgi:hypothetical protein
MPIFLSQDGEGMVGQRSNIRDFGVADHDIAEGRIDANVLRLAGGDGDGGSSPRRAQRDQTLLRRARRGEYEQHWRARQCDGGETGQQSETSM